MKKKSLLLLIPFAAAAAVALGSCGKEPGPQCDQASVILDSQAITIEINETKQLTASSNMEGCSVEVNWRSDDASIASVDQNGVVTGHKNGSTIVYANDVPCLVTVGSGHADVHVESMVLVSPSSQSPSMNIGDQLDISVDILPENADNKLVTVTSDNENVAIINESGNIEAVGEGNAVVSVVSQDNPEVKIDIHVSVSIPDAPVPEATANGFALLKSGEVQSGEAVVFSGIDGNKYLTMGTHETGKNNIPAVESSINSDNKLVLNSKAGVYIALKNEDGSFSFKDSNNKYLSAAGGTKNNYLKTVDEIDETAKFNVVVTDGVATIVCTSENIDRNTIALNSANQSGPIFSCYKSSSAAGYAKINLYHGEASTDVTGVAFEHEKYEVMVDYTITAKAVVAPITATDKAITYSLEDLNPAGCATVETVDNEAVVHGIAEGVGKLVATTHEGSFTSKVTLEVKPKGSIVIPVTGIKLAAKSGTVTVGETKQITASVLPEDATSQAISFESLNTDLATVDPDGLVTAIAAGTAKIKVYATDYPEVSETYTLTIKEATVSYPLETSEGRVLIENGTLTDGASINIVAGNDGALVAAEGALSGTNKYLAVVSCGVDSEKLVLGAGAGTFTVVANKDGSYSFKTAGGKYLAANPDKNQIIEVPAINQAAKFSVNIVNGAASIICTDPDNLSHNTMLYNTGDPRFACYSSSFSGVAPRIYSMDPEPVDAEGIELDVEEKVIALNEEYQLDATVLPSWAKDKNVTWTTESKGVVSVTNGLVKGLAEGTEVVTATDIMGHTASCSFTVVSEIKHPESITLSEHSLALDVDDIHDTLSATVLPADAYNKNFTWASDNEDVVKVDENGKLECVGAGSANITVITEDGGKTDTCAVSVAAAADGVVHAYEAAMAMEPNTGASEFSYTISGRIMFMPGNNLIVQDGDHAIIVYKTGQSTKDMQVGKKVTMRCQVQNYNGAAETVQIKNEIITVSNDEVTVNKATIDSSDKMDASAMPLTVDFKNLVLKSDPNVTSGGNASITVAYEDNLEKEYTLYAAKTMYSETVAAALNELKTGSKLEIQNAYISGYSSGRQICIAPDSVVIDHSTYAPESVVVKNGEDVVTSLNLVTGSNATLTASVLPAKASQDVVWETEDNDGVISLENGAVGALKAGAATIVVSSADKTQSTRIGVTVTDEEVLATSVSLDEHAVDLFVDGIKQLTATVLPEGATDKSIEWSVVEGGEVVSVNNGLVTALAEGTAVVQAKNVKSGFSDTCTFTVTKKIIDVDSVDSITLTAAEDSLNLGSYGSGSNEYYAWTDLAKNNGNIQGNCGSGKDSELHNLYEFSRPIKYVKITVGAAAAASNTLEMRFGDTAKPEGNAIAMGAETMYDLTTAGNSFVLKPEVAAKYFSLKNTKGATYLSSIEVGFVDYVVHVSDLTLDKEAVSLTVEEQHMIVPTITPSDATNKNCTFSSDHPEIASVNYEGLVTAVSEGSATITVTTEDGSLTKTCVITVVASKVAVEKVELDKDSLALTETESSKLTATVTPEDATNKDVVWSVKEDNGVVSVDQEGNVTALQAGTATVVAASAADTTKYDECVVTVSARIIDVSENDPYALTKDGLGLTGSYANSKENADISFTQLGWYSSSIQGNSSKKSEVNNAYAFSSDIVYIRLVIAVDKADSIVNISFGSEAAPTGNTVTIGKDTEQPLVKGAEYIISAPSGCKYFDIGFASGAANFSEIEIGFSPYVKHVTDISLDITEKTMEVGDTYTLTPTVSPDDADNKEVTYVSDHPEFATVDAATGEITAVAPGTATITATTTDGGLTATCEITVVDKVVAVTDISLDKDTLDLVEGEDSTLVATVTPDDATHPEHTWTSSDETVATVDQDGKVTAVAPGEATITVKVDGDESKYAECVVTVTAAPRQVLPYNGSFSTDDSGLNYAEGWTGTAESYYTTGFGFKKAGEYIEAIKLFEPLDNVQVDITSLINSADVDTGEITIEGLNDAGATVTLTTLKPNHAKFDDVKSAQALATVQTVVLSGKDISGLRITYTTKSANMLIFSVDVADASVVTGVELNESELTMELGEKGALVATVMPETALNKNYTFSSDHPEIVSVDENTGAIEALAIGNTTITVTTEEGSFKATCAIEVIAKKVAVESVTLDKDILELIEGGNETLVTTLTPDEPTNPTVVWSSSDETVVTVDQTGKVTAVAPGTATITAAAEDDESIKDECVVTVSQKFIEVTTNTPYALDKTELGLSGTYGNSVAGADIAYNQWSWNSNSFQGSKDKGTTVGNAYAFSEDIKYIKFVVSQDKANSTLSVYFGDSANPTSNEVKMGKDTEYPLTAGAEYIIAAPEDVAFFGLKYTSGATNFSSIEIGFEEYTIHVESISLEKDELSLEVGGTATLNPIVLPEDATHPEVKFSSDTPAVATVDENTGLVTAVAPGNATITATTVDGGKTATCSVEVVEDIKHVTGVSLNKDATSLFVGENETLTATVSPDDATNQRVTWSSSDISVATVVDGKITAIGAGEATITVTTEDNELTDTCVVTVSAKTIDVDTVEKLTLTPENLGLDTSYSTTEAVTEDGNYSYTNAIKGNSSIQMKKDGGGELHNNYAFSREIKYVKISITKAAADSAKASMFFGNLEKPTGNETTLGNGGSYAINAIGNVVIKPAAGSTYFSLKATNGTIYFASIEFGFVDYVAPAVENVTLDQTTLEMNVGGDPVTLTPTILPADSEPKSMVWASDKETVATVNNGVVTAVGEGTANITYTVDGKVGTCVVTVVTKKAIESITITGDMTNKAYAVGDSFDPTGLVASATYVDKSTADLTNEVEWVFNPTTASSTEINSVTVKAKVDTIESNSLTINSISVVEPTVLSAKGWGGITTNSFKNENVATTIDDIEYCLYGFNGNTGQVRGSKAAASDGSDDKGNFHLYNTTELTDKLEKITLIDNSTDASGFQNTFYVYFSNDAAVGSKTSIDETVDAGSFVKVTLSAVTKVVEIDLSGYNFKYFKLMSGTAKCASGTTKNVKINLQFAA